MDIKAFVKKIIGSQHDREVAKLQPLIDEINEIAEELSELSEEELRGKTEEFRAYIAERTDPIKEQIRELRVEKARSTDIGDREQLSMSHPGSGRAAERCVGRRVGRTPAGGVRGGEGDLSSPGREGDRGDRPEADLGHGAV
jgi:hypothetical protein